VTISLTRVPRTRFERAFAAGLVLSMVWALVAIGARELAWAAQHPEEGLAVVFALPFAIAGYGLYVLFTPTRTGKPWLLIACGVLAALLGLGALYMMGLAQAFKN
jgi:hypothetical protein